MLLLITGTLPVALQAAPSLPVADTLQSAWSTQDWLVAMSATDAVRSVERQTGGRVLSVNEEERGGSRVFRVKVLLPEGRVRTIFIDKQTGAQREG